MEDIHGLRKHKYLLDSNLEHGLDVENRVIRITGTIGNVGDDEFYDFTTFDTCMNILEANGNEDITVKIHSPGGHVYEALAIVGRLTSSPCKVITEGYGYVMSAATLILMSGDHRRLSKYAVSMYHSAQYQIEQSDHETVKAQVKQVEREEKLWLKYYEEFSKKKATWWRQKMRGKEYFPDADEMKKIGACDELF